MRASGGYHAKLLTLHGILSSFGSRRCETGLRHSAISRFTGTLLVVCKTYGFIIVYYGFRIHNMLRVFHILLCLSTFTLVLLPCSILHYQTRVAGPAVLLTGHLQLIVSSADRLQLIIGQTRQLIHLDEPLLQKPAAKDLTFHLLQAIYQVLTQSIVMCQGDFVCSEHQKVCPESVHIDSYN